MQRINLRTPEGWRTFDFIALIIALLLLVLVLIFWFADIGHSDFCCKKEDTPKIVQEPAPKPEPVVVLSSYQLMIQQTTQGIVLEGLVDSDETKASVEKMVNATFENTTIINALQIRENITNVPTSTLSRVINKAQAQNVSNIVLRANDETVRLSGDTQAEGIEANIERQLRQDTQLLNTLNSPVDVELNVIKPKTLVPEVIPQVVEPIIAPPIVKVDCHKALASSNIEFAFGRYGLSEKGKRQLDAIMPCLEENRFLIVGHTDSVGSEQANLTLSQRRAKSVADYLVTKGIPSTRFETDGKGESSPLFANDTAEQRKLNRRIEFIKR